MNRLAQMKLTENRGRRRLAFKEALKRYKLVREG
jgi:hypothetical protein